MRWFVFEVLLRWLRPIEAQMVGRSRYSEDLLEDAVASGIHQYVVLGAGLDSFAMRRRDLESSVRIFELDHPDTQELKRRRLASLGVELPSNLEFAAFDFERETLSGGLARCGYEPERPAFFSLLGTAPYLTTSATLHTLASIARCAALRSEVVFDYLVPAEILPPQDARVLGKLKRATSWLGEPLLGEFHPEEVGEALRSIGLELIENLSAAEQERRYFANRRDGMRPTPGSFFAHARVSEGAA